MRWLGLVLLLLPHAAFAEPPTRVSVTFAVPAADTSAERATRELLGRIGISVVSRRVETIDASAVFTPRPEPGVLAQAWIQLDEGEEAAIYIVDSERKRLLVRRVSHMTPAMAREAILNILVTAIEALQRGETIGVALEAVTAEAPAEKPAVPEARAPAPAPASPPHVAERAETPRAGSAPARVETAVLYEVTTFASSASLLHGPVGLIGFRGAGGRLGALASAQLRWPIQVTRQPVSLRIFSGASRLLFSFRFLSVRSSYSLDGLLGGGLDVLYYDPSVARGAGSASASSASVIPVVRAGLASRVALSSGVSLFSELACDVDFTQTEYVFTRNAERIPLFQPLPLRPSVGLGAAFP